MAIRALNISHGKSKVSARVTVSLGIATVIPHRRTKSEELIARTDHTLYFILYILPNNREEIPLRYMMNLEPILPDFLNLDS